MAVILITCAGSGVGQSVIDSINLDGRHFILGCDNNINVYAKSFCNNFFKVPNITSPDYLDTILDLCFKHHVEIVIPGNDNELSLFSSNKDRFNSKGIEIIVSENEMIQISRDKLNWFKYFSQFKCNIVPTYSVKEVKANWPTELKFPIISKPAAGSASQNINILNSLEDIQELSDLDIIQPYLFPSKEDENYERILSAVNQGKLIQYSEISIQLIFSKESKLLDIFISKNILKLGVPVYIEPIDVKNFEHLDEINKFIPILEAQKTVGPVNLQGRITDSGLYFFEMNMRFTGITGNRAQLGFNEVVILIDNFLGHSNPRIFKDLLINKIGTRQVASTTIFQEKFNKVIKTVVILGGGSNLGRKFIEKEVEGFEKIFLVAREASFENYKDSFSHPNLVVLSENEPDILELLCKCDVLINFVSALANSPENEKFEAMLFIQRWNAKIIKSKIPLIINISSQSVYPQDLNIRKDENVQCIASNTYSFQKIVIEQAFKLVKDFSPESQVINLRLPRVLNPDKFETCGVWGELVRIQNEGKTTIIPHPQNNTCLLHILDFVSALNFIISNSNRLKFPFIMNVEGENISLENYCKGIEKLIVSSQKNIKLENSNSVISSSMISGRLLNELGWKAKFSVDDIILDLFKNFN